MPMSCLLNADGAGCRGEGTKYAHELSAEGGWRKLLGSRGMTDVSINRAIDQSINQSIDQSINQSIDQSINQSINQSTNQSINESINQ